MPRGWPQKCLVRQSVKVTVDKQLVSVLPIWAERINHRLMPRLECRSTESRRRAGYEFKKVTKDAGCRCGTWCDRRQGRQSAGPGDRRIGLSRCVGPQCREAPRVALRAEDHPCGAADRGAGR